MSSQQRLVRVVWLNSNAQARCHLVFGQQSARVRHGAMDVGRTAPDTTAAPPNKRRRVVDGVGESDGVSDGARADASCCPICLESEGELLQRGCCCRGDSGVVHLTCMVQAATYAATYQGWWYCGTCKQRFTGAVQVGLARAWWATVVAANDEGDHERIAAAGNLASAHSGMGEHAEAETLQVAVLVVRKRVLGEEHPGTLTSV